jgi:hypothetical protein
MNHLLLIKQDDVQKGGVYQFSDQIINGLRKETEMFVVGVGSAISMACMAVQRASSISKVAIDEVSLDYVGSPALGLGGVFFILNKESTRDWDAEKTELEKKMKLTFEHGGQLIVVSNALSPEKAIPLSLSRLSQSDLLKISAAGSAINRAALIALELTKGNIARDRLGLCLVAISTVKHTVKETVVPETVMDIFIRKGFETVYSKKHNGILKMLTTG